MSQQHNAHEHRRCRKCAVGMGGSFPPCTITMEPTSYTKKTCIWLGGIGACKASGITHFFSGVWPPITLCPTVSPLCFLAPFNPALRCAAPHRSWRGPRPQLLPGDCLAPPPGNGLSPPPAGRENLVGIGPPPTHDATAQGQGWGRPFPTHPQ